jgi:ribonuclease P protein component
MLARQFTFGKNDRLKSRKQIEQLFAEGKTFTVFPYRMYYKLHGEAFKSQNRKSSLQFGVGVSGKNFKKAVDRNRIKRLTKEAWRLQKVSLQQKLKEKDVQLNVFFIYSSRELEEYKYVYEKVHLILSKLIKLIDENNSPPS